MSFLLQKALNPHILLHALSLPPANTLPQTPLQRLNLLARTRQFQAIENTVQTIKDISFPSLTNKLGQAKVQSQSKKEELGLGKLSQILKQLNDLSKAEDPDFQKIDQGQANLFELSKILFDEGNYQKSLEILVELEKQDLKQELWIKCTWARLYCEIVMNRDSIKTLQFLKKKIEELETQELAFYSKEKAANDSLMKKLYAQKEEFLLLALFSVFRSAGDEELQKFVDFCTADKNFFSIIQLTCPELLRYVIIALIMNKTLQNNRAFDLFKLVEVINRRYIKYTDAFTEFISLLEIEYDFEEATAKIEDCKEAIKKDIFLAAYQQKIIEGLHFLYFKRACKVYDTIPLKEIATFTGFSADDAQFWILGYIRSGDIDAKIDSIAQLVVNNKGRHNPSEKYLDVIPAVGGLVNSLSRAITIK